MADRTVILQEQFEDAAQQHEAAQLGMWTFLATEIMFFGGLFVWMMILATHIRFRRRFTGKLIFRAPFYPWASASGIAALAAITISTWWVPGMKITLIAGLPWLAFISLCYLLWPGSSRRV